MATVYINSGNKWTINGSGWQTGYINSHANITISVSGGTVTVTCSNLQTTSTGGDSSPWYARIWYEIRNSSGTTISSQTSSYHYFNNGNSYHGAGQTYYTGTFSTSFSLSSYPTAASVRAGYTFYVSGYESYSGGTMHSSGTISTVSLTVTFNSQGGLPQPPVQYVNYGGTATRPGLVTRAGYTFDNWYTASTGGSVFDFSTVITSSITLYAHWNTITYTISYNLDGGSISGNPTSYTVEDTVVIPNPTKTQYRFIGWSGTDIPSGSYISNLQWNPGSYTGSRSYKANWAQNVFVLSYDATQGTSAPPSQYCNENDFITLTGEATWSGGRGAFRNWNDKIDGSGVTYNPGASLNMDTDITLYAMWNYRVRVHTNGGGILIRDSEIDSAGNVLTPGIMLPIIADPFSSTSDYTVGDYCTYNNTSYLCHTAVDITQTGGAWTGSSNWTEIASIPPIDYDGFDSTKSYNPGDKIVVLNTSTLQWETWVCIMPVGPMPDPFIGPWQVLGIAEYCSDDSSSQNDDFVQLGKTQGSTLRIPFKLDRMGYTALGLSTNKNSTTATYPYVTSNSDPSVHYVDYPTDAPNDLYVIWQPSTYTVTFKDGFSENNDIIKVISNIPYGGSVSQAEVPVPGNYYGDPYNKYFIHPEGYEFIAWAGDYNNVTSDMIVVAQWEFCAVWILVQVGQTKMWLPYKPEEGS